MKKLNIALTILMSLGVAACGSSGGDNSAQPSNNQQSSDVVQPTESAQQSVEPTQQPTESAQQSVEPTQQPTESAQQPGAANENAQNQNPYADNAEIVGAGFTIPRSERKIVAVALKDGVKENFNLLHVEGKTLPIVPNNGISVGKSVHITAKNMMNIASKGKYTSAGFVWVEGLENQYMIAMGKEATKQMPTQGKAEYIGQGVVALDSTGGNKINSAARTQANLTADFDTKKLAGTITTQEIPNFVPVTLSADITQNLFYGNADNTTVQGGFYGPNADEVTGNYIRSGENVPSAIGVFQANKK